MQASAGSGRSGAAARAAGPVSLSLRERPVNACIECRLRIFDGNGFSESDLVGRPSDPKPETILRNLENICRERGVLNIRVSLDCCSYNCMPCVCFWPAAMADVFDLPPSAAGQLASIRRGAHFTMLPRSRRMRYSGYAGRRCWASLPRARLPLSWRSIHRPLTSLSSLC